MLWVVKKITDKEVGEAAVNLLGLCNKIIVIEMEKNEYQNVYP